MVTLLNMTDDDQRLIDTFELLRGESQSELLRRLAIAACFAVLSRTDRHSPDIADKSPEAVTEAFLMRCMPPVPCGYRDDFGFEDSYHRYAVPLLRRRCLTAVLGSSRFDATRAEELADDLTECAMQVRADFCAPNFAEDGFLSTQGMQEFIEEWRDSFTSNLAREASKPGA